MGWHNYPLLPDANPTECSNESLNGSFKTNQLLEKRCDVIDYKRIVHKRDVVCRHCGSSSRLTVHHVIPRCKKGPSTPENCILLCQSCHRALHLQEGYPVRSRPKQKTKGRRGRKHRRQLEKERVHYMCFKCLLSPLLVL